MFNLSGPMVFLAGVLALGCSDSAGPPAIESCRESWHPLVSAANSSLITFASSGGQVFYTSRQVNELTSNGIEVVQLKPVGGGPEVLTSTQFASRLWAEPDALLLHDSGQLVSVNLNTRLQSVLLDLGVENESLAIHVAVSSSEIFWSRSTSEGIELLQASRSEGKAISLYANDEAALVHGLHLLGDNLVVILEDSFLLIVPLSGGMVRRIPAIDGDFVGVGPNGVYYRKQAAIPARGGQVTRQELWFVPIGAASSRLLWTAPPGYALSGVAVEREGVALTLGGSEVFDNGARHATLRSFSARGETEILACDPLAGRAIGAPVSIDSGTVVSIQRNGDWELAFVAD